MNGPYLNRALTLEAPVQVPDGAGGYSAEWEVLGVVWGEVKAGIGRERAAFAVTVSRVPYRITVRAMPYGAPSRPMAGQRFRDEGRIFHINAVADKGHDGRFLTCHVEEEVAS